MVMNKELTYWLALAHVSRIRTKKKNEIIVRLFEKGKSIIDFFESEQTDWGHDYELNQTEIELFVDAKKELPNYAFLVEDLLAQGYNILPITSSDYSPTLKKNLGRTWSGVIDGLRKGRTIFVRKPDSKEKNANNMLILKGGKAVDVKGNLIGYDVVDDDLKTIVAEDGTIAAEEKIVEFLKTGVFSAKKIVDTLKIDWSSRKVSNFLKSRPDVLTVKGKPLKFSHRSRTVQTQKTLFD